MTAMLRDPRPARLRRRQGHPQGHRPHHQPGRGPRHHGAQRLGQEHLWPCAHRPRGRRRSPSGSGALRGQGPARPGARGARTRRRLPRLPVPGRDPRHQQQYAPASAGLNAIREHRGEPELDAMDFLKLARENEPARDGPRDAQPRRQRRFQRRREEAQRDLPDGSSSSPSLASSTRPTPVSTSTRSRSWPRASTHSAAPTARSWSSPTTSGCWTTSCRTSSTCWPTAAS